MRNIEIKTNQAMFEAVTQKPLIRMLDRMAQATVSGGKMTCPKKNKQLAKTGRWRGSGMQRTVIFGGKGLKNYAPYQERGQRLDGSHKVRHYTTAGTGAHFLKNAGDAVRKKGPRAYL